MYVYIGEKIKTIEENFRIILSGGRHDFTYLLLQIEEFRLHWYLEITPN